MPDRPEIVGFHHVRVPVSDVLVSRDWYIDTFELEPLMVTEEESSVTGVALVHPSGLVLGLHAAPTAARALAGFCVVAFGVDDLSAWCEHCDRAGIEHGPIVNGHRGRHMSLADPDGLMVELHTQVQPSSEDT